MAAHFQVTRLHRTSDGAPSEWEGITDDSRGIYVRYGGGELTIYLGDPDDGPELAEANGRLLLLKVVELEDPSASAMNLAELRSHTAGFITWPDEETEVPGS